MRALPAHPYLRRPKVPFSFMLKAKPAVFIFGWLGAKPYHIARVASFYKDLDVECIPYIQHPISMLNVREDKKGFERLYEKAIDRPVMCHLFSMNGASVFYKAFTGSDLVLKPNINLRALVLDSTPGHINRELYHRAFANALFPRSRYLANAANFALKPVFDAFLFGARSHRAESQKQIRALYRHPIQAPTLMFSSARDELIPFQDQLEYAERAREAGITVQTRIWPDSGHIRMYRDHRPEYISLCRSFAQKYLLQSQ